MNKLFKDMSMFFSICKCKSIPKVFIAVIYLYVYDGPS